MLIRLHGVSPTGAGKIADDGAVARAELTEIGRAHKAGGAVLVLNDDRWRTVDVLGNVFREQPALDIGRTARSEIHQECEALALVERLVGGGDGHAGENRQGGTSAGDCGAQVSRSHRSLLCAQRCRQTNAALTT